MNIKYTNKLILKNIKSWDIEELSLYNRFLYLLSLNRFLY